MKNILLIPVIALMACTPQVEKEQIIEQKNLPEEEIVPANSTADFETYLDGFEKEKASHENIPVSFLSQFVAPALEVDEHTGHFHFYEDFEYSYGKLLYGNKKFVAVTFFTEGDDGWNLLDGEILAIYSASNGKFIDSRLISESSEYELGSLHYNDMEYKVNILNEENVAFKISCDLIIETFDREDENTFDKGGEIEKMNFIYSINTEGHIIDI